MEKECDCGNVVDADDPKGDGVHFVWWCEECEKFI